MSFSVNGNFVKLKTIKNLFPDSFIVGDSDRLPGLRHDYLPYHEISPEEIVKDIELEDTTLLHISGIRI
jgi:hypothetical protein